MKRCLLALFLICCFALTACSRSDGASALAQPSTAPEETPNWDALPSDGLSHDPYGWDSLYGSKEVPDIWWNREPSDGLAGEQTCINVAVGKSLEDREIWIEWEKNGARMEPIQCHRRAELQTDGVEKIKYCGYIPSLETGDAVAYIICAGLNGIAEKSLGTFNFSTASWEPLRFTGMSDFADGSAAFLGKAGEIQAAVAVRILENGVVALEIQNTAETAETVLGNGIAAGSLRMSAAEDGRILLEKDGEILLQCRSIDILTDGEMVRAVRLTVDAEETDSFYGFGMKYDSLNQRGKKVDMYCVNWYKDQNNRTYTPVPYYFVPDRYGLFVDTTYYSCFDICTEPHGDTCVIEIHTGGTNGFSVPVYLFSGNNAQIAAAYASVAGSAALPPVWAFGPWISANEWDKQSEIMEQLDQTLKHKIPTSVLVIEAWSDEQTFYTFNDSRFESAEGGATLAYEDFTFAGRWPDPKAMVAALHDHDVKCLLWQIPVLKYDTAATAQSVRDQIYATEQGYVLKYNDGSIYRLPGGTWFGNSLLLDFTNEAAARWFLEKRRYLLEDIGIDGFKTDGGEFVWGRDVVAADGTRGDELRNAYPDLYAQAYYDYGNKIADEIITFSRSGGSSMQKHPLCWVGDQNSDFAAFQDAIRATLSASMSGIPFVAWDIAGFSGDVPPAELYQRSVAQAAFSPVMQIHSESAGDPEPSQARTPWNMAARKGDDACLETYRYYANLRMNLLPYIYTEAKWSSETGEPLMRSMAYAFPEDQTAARYEFQYLFGRNLLVAPVTTPSAKKIEVYLPEGVWYDFFTGDCYGSGSHTIPVAADQIPVFARAGTILPVNTDETGTLASYVGNGTDSYENLSYLVFPGRGSYTWYDYVGEREINVTSDGTVVTSDDGVIPATVKWMGERG